MTGKVTVEPCILAYFSMHTWAYILYAYVDSPYIVFIYDCKVEFQAPVYYTIKVFHRNDIKINPGYFGVYGKFSDFYTK